LPRFDQVRVNIRRAYESGRATVRAAREPPPVIPQVPALEQLEDDVPPFDSSVHVVHTSTASRDDVEIPKVLRVAAAWSWRLILIVAAAWAVMWMLGRLHKVVIPVAIALLLSALLSPAVGWLVGKKVHRTLATSLVVIGGVVLVAGTLTLVVTEFVNNYGRLADQTQGGLASIQRWLKNGPLHLTDKQLNGALDTAQTWLKDHQSNLTTGALSTATTALDVVASMFLVMFTTFFFLRDGSKIWRFLVDLLPRGARRPLFNAGLESWHTLTAYVRATVLVAFIDAVGIGIWLTVWRIELAFALAALVFLGAFIPIIGATLSGTVAVLVALVTHGPGVALIILAGVIGIQQLEGHILQPLIMGRAVSIHPLAVILAIATGLVTAGIIGALVAVPIVAVLNTGIRHLAAHRRHQPPPPEPDAVVVRDSLAG
jgi:predicted PurR-regulated permease PerM